ncbi:unnamed protein product [Brassica rapa]|uniref:Uncharacterized protein n=1 Tax=Brassica campestris TaxID=3711 RepID=A0A3P5YTX6_BRACM|nr:unnamed protein product [Brassica rapa]VDC67094.1 unnamed protein product [Brassica rapa]
MLPLLIPPSHLHLRCKLGILHLPTPNLQESFRAQSQVYEARPKTHIY